MLDEQQIQEAIGIPKVGVSVMHSKRGGPTTVVVDIMISGSTDIPSALIHHAQSAGDQALCNVVARKLRDELLHKLFTILEETNAPDLQRIKFVARRDGMEIGSRYVR